MKHLSDDDITRELKMLGQSFRPSSRQKEKLHRQIFQPSRHKTGFRPQTWLPTFVSLIVLISVCTGIFVFFNNEYHTGAGESSGKGELITDVTSSWNDVLLSQTSRTSPTYYEIIFAENLLVIEDRFTSIGFGYDPNLSEEEALKRYKINEKPLEPGRFTKYSIKKKNDTYTIKVDGKQGFTYTLKKVAPRKFVGEEGIEYSTSTYLE